MLYLTYSFSHEHQSNCELTKKHILYMDPEFSEVCFFLNLSHNSGTAAFLKMYFLLNMGHIPLLCEFTKG